MNHVVVTGAAGGLGRAVALHLYLEDPVAHPVEAPAVLPPGAPW